MDHFFNNYSDYKSNKLGYYFTRKSLEDYSKQKRDKPKRFETIIFSGIFTHLTTQTPWFKKIELEYTTISYLLFLIFLYITIVAFYLLIWELMMAFRNLRAKNSRRHKESLKNFNHFKDEFNHEIKDQIAIALRLTESSRNVESPTEKRFYTLEAFDSVNDAMSKLSVLVNKSKKFREVQAYNKEGIFSKHRIQNLIDISTETIEKIKENFQTLKCEEQHSSEVDQIEKRINRLSENLKNLA